MICELEVVEVRADGKERRRCVKCQKLTRWLRPGGKYMRECGPPSMLEKAARYVASQATWAASGFPLTSPEQQAVRWEKCSGCPSRLDGVCLICGCPVNPVFDGSVPNKLRAATEACPKDPPEWSFDSTAFGDMG